MQALAILKPDNLLPLLAACRDDIDLTKYHRPGQRIFEGSPGSAQGVCSSSEEARLATEVAGRRPSIEKDPVRGGILRFGTDGFLRSNCMRGSCRCIARGVDLRLDHASSSCSAVSDQEIGTTAWTTKLSHHCESSREDAVYFREDRPFRAQVEFSD